MAELVSFFVNLQRAKKTIYILIININHLKCVEKHSKILLNFTIIHLTYVYACDHFVRSGCVLTRFRTNTAPYQCERYSKPGTVLMIFIYFTSIHWFCFSCKTISIEIEPIMKCIQNVYRCEFVVSFIAPFPSLLVCAILNECNVRKRYK